MELAFLNIGTQEMFVIVVVILLLFGGKKLPELARGLGRGIREFKDASEGIKKEIADQINNFEKDLDVTREDQEESTYASNTDTPIDGEEEAIEEHTDEEIVEKKFPDFTAPENTYQHDPGAHPVDETEYYKYGYNDYFATDQTEESDEGSVENTGKEDDKPSEQA